MAVALDSATLTALETIELGATTLAALETIGLDATTLAALETIELGATTLAALETITIGTALPAGTNNIGDVDVLTLPAENRPSSAAVTQVASSASSVTLQASNAARRGLSIYNDSTAALYVKFGTTASATSFTVKITSQGFYEVPAPPVYTGRVDGLWASAQGNAYVTEVSA